MDVDEVQGSVGGKGHAERVEAIRIDAEIGDRLTGDARPGDRLAGGAEPLDRRRRCCRRRRWRRWRSSRKSGSRATPIGTGRSLIVPWKNTDRRCRPADRRPPGHWAALVGNDEWSNSRTLPGSPPVDDPAWGRSRSPLGIVVIIPGWDEAAGTVVVIAPDTARRRAVEDAGRRVARERTTRPDARRSGWGRIPVPFRCRWRRRCAGNRRRSRCRWPGRCRCRSGQEASPHREAPEPSGTGRGRTRVFPVKLPWTSFISSLMAGCLNG